jgi:PAS domain S-box-containing protein
VTDQDADITSDNRRIEEMLGKHWFSFMDERGVEITRKNLQRREQCIGEQWAFEFLRKDGSWLYGLLETSPIFDDHGNFVAGIAGMQEIAERSRAAETLRVP